MKFGLNGGLFGLNGGIQELSMAPVPIGTERARLELIAKSSLLFTGYR
jgi:hypothetical protein